MVKLDNKFVLNSATKYYVNAHTNETANHINNNHVARISKNCDIEKHQILQ